MDTITPEFNYSVVSKTIAPRTNVQETTVQFANAWLDSVSILFAPGHNALTGVFLTYNGKVFLPWDGFGTYIIGSNERLEFDVGMYMPGPITITQHNGDGLKHQHVLTFKWHTYTKPTPISNGQSLPLVLT